jgi:transcriptional regulator with XRE-family HTH domain
MDATILDGVDWTRVREELKECRQAVKLNQVALAKKIGVNKSTVNRIENVYGEPDHKPDLETIAAWTEATGFTLSSFFATIESGHETGIATTGGAPRDRAVQAITLDVSPDLEELGQALAKFIHAIARQQAPAARPARSGGRAGHRKNR